MAAEAAKLIREAEKAAAYKSWFGGTRLDEAADLYSRAANSFKLAKQWREAGDAYISQANILLKAGERNEAAGAYLNASKAYKKDSPRVYVAWLHLMSPKPSPAVPPDAVNSLEQAVQLYVEAGRFSAAAMGDKQAAELYEELGDLEKARGAYCRAADWYQADDSTS
ncbi:hypothetical protein HK405_014030, partial [Cladochytrium tenue]